MKVKLIQITKNPIDVMWAAARTCYSEKSPIEMWEELGSKYSEFGVNETQDREAIDNINKEIDKHWNLVKKVLDSGHQSIAEHVYFTFAIEGISRACSHQLVRHRAGIVFSQQSQRYVEIKESEEDLENAFNDNYDSSNFTDSRIYKILDKYFTEVNFHNVNGYFSALDNYLYAIKSGDSPEDARRFLPNATKTNITMSINLRELIHVSNLRLCTRAQLEIRQLFQAIKKEVEQADERLAELLVPSCEVHGFCTEGKCCGRKPHISKIMADYSSEDKVTPELAEAMKNPKFNEKLSELIKMNSVIE